MRGKLNGSVIQGTIGGFQMRTKVKPRNPRSPGQQRTRGLCGFTRQQWNFITAPQRDTWNDNAPPDQTGISFYQATQQKISLTGEPVIAEFDPAGLDTTPEISFVGLTPSVFVLAFPDIVGVLPADTWLNVYVTPQLSAGTSFITRTQYRHLQSFSPGTDIETNVDIYARYIDVYGVPVETSIIGVKALLINSAGGLASDMAYNQQAVGPDV